MLFYKKKETFIQFENEFTKEVKNETEVDVQSIKSYTLSDTRNPPSMPPADPEFGNSKSTFVDPELGNSKSTFIDPELGNSTFVDSELGNTKSTFISRTKRKL